MSDDNMLEEMQTEADESQIASQMDLAEMEPDFGLDNNEQNMDFLLDIPLEISVELGNAKITIGELLKLSQGSVVELNKLTNEPLDIFVNKKLMAYGEVVVVNDKFGIRLTNIVSPGDRVKGLT
jgi:flagellar motor switch protein FliN/FliY